jgi:hypothetical protein
MELPWEFSQSELDWDGKTPLKRNLPTPEGRELGREMARLTGDPDEAGCCHDCAFRLGTDPNGCGPTLMDALKCVVEGVPFNCHVNAGPCAGFVAWRQAFRTAPAAGKE